MINHFRFEDDLIEAKMNVTPKGIEIEIGENCYSVKEITPRKFAVDLNGARKMVCCVIEKDKAYLDVEGLLLELAINLDDTANSVAGGAALAKDKIFAPMPGKVVKILVAEGDNISAKQPMVIVEAMKMENQVNSPAAGTVKKINFRDGDQVGTDIPIIELEIESDPENNK
ncbi:hypothetical protein TRIP_C30072 [Candidatus Zixiibacteriota bacterium]|nr:hypothetical protein TRIP_C30072 [candidate division Zixibacteria bacterium]